MLRLRNLVLALILPVVLMVLTAAIDKAETPPHRGPEVSTLASDSQKVAKILLAEFQSQRAMELVRFVDGYYREPANDGYEAVLERILKELKTLGFSAENPRFQLQVLETPMKKMAWTPVRGQLDLLLPEKKPETLLAFDTPAGVHRTMLPTNCISGDVTGRVVFEWEQLKPGDVFVTDLPLVTTQWRAQRAAAVLSSHIADYNVDPTGANRHLEAIAYGRVRPGGKQLTAHISARVFHRLTIAAKNDDMVKVRLQSEVKRSQRMLRTVVATFVGCEVPGEVIPIACHIQEPGAVDNASGVGGFVEGIRALKAAIDSGKIPVARRSVAIIWGNEMQQSRIFLKHTQRRVIAAFSADMIGASQKKTGAIALLERDPDPGALLTLAPDQHTAWGAGRVREESFKPNGLSTITRCAMLDVAALTGGWQTAEHPWEGGSDHDVFLRQGVPAVLIWHFTDFAYHTSLDRMHHIDPEAIRRTTVAILISALAVASPSKKDLKRYLESSKLSEDLRVEAAKEANQLEIAKKWQQWSQGERKWLEGLRSL